MKYDSLFKVLDINNTNIISYENLCIEQPKKYVYYASKENYKILNNEFLHDEFRISPNPGQASCKLISLEDINNKYFSNENFIFDKTIGYKEFHYTNDKLKKPFKNINVYIKTNSNIPNISNNSVEGYMYCISINDFNSNKENIQYIKKYKIKVNYNINKEE